MTLHMPAPGATFRIQKGCKAARWSFACNNELSARERLRLGAYWETEDRGRGFYPPGGSHTAHDYWCIVDEAEDRRDRMARLARRHGGGRAMDFTRGRAGYRSVADYDRDGCVTDQYALVEDHDTGDEQP